MIFKIENALNILVYTGIYIASKRGKIICLAKILWPSSDFLLDGAAISFFRWSSDFLIFYKISVQSDV
jgi:hypothetical protein